MRRALRFSAGSRISIRRVERLFRIAKTADRKKCVGVRLCSYRAAVRSTADNSQLLFVLAVGQTSVHNQGIETAEVPEIRGHLRKLRLRHLNALTCVGPTDLRAQ